MATRRLAKERASFEKTPLDFCQVDIVNDDVFQWRCTLTGPPDTPYQGGNFVVSMDFPTQYPFKPPKVKFVTKIYHPSVKTDTGEICADIIGEGWGPTLNVRHCLNVIYQMMAAPDGDHPLEEEIAQLLRDKPKEFEKKAKKYTKEFAK